VHLGDEEQLECGTGEARRKVSEAVEAFHERALHERRLIRPSFDARDSMAALATSPKNTDPGVVGHGAEAGLAISDSKEEPARARLVKKHRRERRAPRARPARGRTG